MHNSEFEGKRMHYIHQNLIPAVKHGDRNIVPHETWFGVLPYGHLAIIEGNINLKLFFQNHQNNNMKTVLLFSYYK